MMIFFLALEYIRASANPLILTLYMCKLEFSLTWITCFRGRRKLRVLIIKFSENNSSIIFKFGVLGLLVSL